MCRLNKFILLIYCQLFFSLNFIYGFDAKSLNLLEKYCFDCHSDGVDKGDFEFDLLLKKPLNSPETKKQWHKIWSVIEEHQMPPADKKKQPSKEEREALLIALEENIFSINRQKRYAAPMKLTRLSNEQYAITIRSLAGSKLEVDKLLPLDPTSAGFSNIGDTLNITPMLFDRYNKIAQQLADNMFFKSPEDPNAYKKGSKMLADAGDGKDLKKVEQVLVSFAREAFRRPVEEHEVKEIMELYNELRAEVDYRMAMKESIRSILVSPNFIFRTELLRTDKIEGNLARLDEYALASRLSYFLWNSQPDKRLLELASKGKLRANLKDQVKRMIRSKYFGRMTRSFGQYWLGIQYIDNNRPNKQIFKGFKTDNLLKMGTETVYFLKYLFQQGSYGSCRKMK